MPDKQCFKLIHYGLIECSGPDAQKFLQGQLSCDMNKLSDSNSLLGVYCNTQGRIIAAFRCFRLNNNLYLRMPKSIIPNTLAHLTKYAMFSKVTLADASDAYCIYGLYGGDTAHIQPTPDQSAIRAVPGEKARFELYISTEQADSVWEKLNHSATETKLDAWHRQDIEMGIASIHPETQELFLPHRLNFQLIDAISFDKGCYLGQEIIARMQYRGKLKHHTYRVHIATERAPKPGTLIMSDDQQKIGHIVDSCPDPKGGCQALIIIGINHTQLKQVIIGTNPPHAIQYLPLPYTWSGASVCEE